MKNQHLLSAAIVAVFGLAVTGGAQAAVGDSAQTPLVVAWQGGATTLDPIMRSENTTYSWQRHIFDTLTFLARSGSIEPRIAVAWKNTAPDTWRITLRKNVKFQDGTAMTPEDVGESILDTANNPKSQLREFANAVSGYKVVDDHTLDVKFKQPDPIFPRHMANIPVMPEREIKKEGRAAFEQHPIGTGPYKFVSWLAQDHLIAEAWKGFWGKQPTFKYVKLESIPNSATRLAALLSGQIQVAEKVEPQDFARVKKSGKAYITMTNGVRVIYLAMDYWRKTDSAGMAKGEKNPFMDPRVRKAVYQSINVKALKDKIFNGAITPASQFMPPQLEAYDPSLKRLPYDPKAAKKLLAEAGYPHGFAVRLDAPNDRYLDDALVAQALGGMLQNVGINVTVNAVPKAVFFPQVNKGDFTMYMAGWGNADPISAYGSLFHCRDKAHGYGHVNRMHYCNPKADKLAEEASTTFDKAKRVKLERESFHVADREDFAYIPLYFEDVIAGVNDHIKWKSRPDELIFAWDMTRK
jgi:peptide/nickel transport system substrate-binding protein